jgi:hypothetical protein
VSTFIKLNGAAIPLIFLNFSIVKPLKLHD